VRIDPGAPLSLGRDAERAPDEEDAGRRPGLRRVYRRHPAAADLCADDVAVSGRRGRCDFVSVRRGPGDLQRAFVAVDRLADDAGAVLADRIGAGVVRDAGHWAPSCNIKVISRRVRPILKSLRPYPRAADISASAASAALAPPA